MSYVSYDVLLKLLIVGVPSCGKTCLLRRFSHLPVPLPPLPPPPSTEGMDFSMRILRVGDQNVKVQVWDSGNGAADGPSIMSLYSRVDAIMIAYDCLSSRSMLAAEALVQTIRLHVSSRIYLVMIGCKADVERAPSSSAAKRPPSAPTHRRGGGMPNQQPLLLDKENDDELNPESSLGVVGDGSGVVGCVDAAVIGSRLAIPIFESSAWIDKAWSVALVPARKVVTRTDIGGVDDLFLFIIDHALSLKAGLPKSILKKEASMDSPLAGRPSSAAGSDRVVTERIRVDTSDGCGCSNDRASECGACILS